MSKKSRLQLFQDSMFFIRDTWMSCRKCGRLKPASGFYRDRKSPIGTTSACRVCIKAAVAERNRCPDVQVRSAAKRLEWRESHRGYLAGKEARRREGMRVHRGG